jgi:hypothetical protein
MLWIEKWGWRRAAKAYARRLGGRLAGDYGGELPYTPEQVVAAVSRLGLNPRYIAIGYAVFVDPAKAPGLMRIAPKTIDLIIARELFDRYKPWGAATSDGWDNSPNTAGFGASGVTAGIANGSGSS